MRQISRSIALVTLVALLAVALPSAPEAVPGLKDIEFIGTAAADNCATVSPNGQVTVEPENCTEN